jgi:phospholipase/carboxylesterase
MVNAGEFHKRSRWLNISCGESYATIVKSETEFVHEFVRGKSGRTLLLLHGTGGDKRDLMPIGRALDANASLLNPRGKVLEKMPPYQ